MVLYFVVILLELLSSVYYDQYIIPYISLLMWIIMSNTQIFIWSQLQVTCTS